jgi:hypothetical protein
LGGIVSSVVRPSSVRTRIQVVSVVRATSRYGDAAEGDAEAGAGVTDDERGGATVGATAAGAGWGCGFGS